MLGKLLNFKKKDNFFLELKEDANLEAATQKVEAVATEIEKNTKKVVAEAKQVVAESQPAIKSKVETVKTEVTQAVEEIAPEIAQSDNKDRKKTKSQKKTTTKTKSNQSQTKVASAPPAIDTSYSDEPFWVKLMYKSSEQQAAEKEAEKGFATEYLISPPKPRRRPGGSLDKFKTMARQTKVRF